MIAGAMLVCVLVGWGAHVAWIDARMIGQETAHKRQMDEALEEVKRLRAQVADLIGKE